MITAASQSTLRVPVRFEVVLELDAEHLRGIVRGLGPDGLSVLVPPAAAVDQDRSVEVICDALPEHPVRLRGRVTAIVPQVHDPRGREMSQCEIEFTDRGRQHDTTVEALVAAFRAAVLLCGFAAPAAEELSCQPGLEAVVLTAATTSNALDFLAAREIAVLCLGPELPSGEAADFLRRTLELVPSSERCHIVLAAGPERELFQDFVDEDQIYYLTQQSPHLCDVGNLLRSALGHYEAAVRHRIEALTADPEADPEAAANAQSVLEMSLHLARETTVERAALLTAQAIERLIEADRAYCLIYDPATQTFWTPQPVGAEERRESAVAGLVSFVIRTGTPVRLEHVGVDPRYDPEADTEHGAPDQRFLAVPVATADHGSAEHRVLAVAVALRDASRQPFSERHRQSLQLLAEQIAPTFARFTLQARLDELDAERHGAMRTEAAKIFRREALEHHTRGFQDQGHLLQLSPGWIRWTYWLLLAVFAAAVLFSVFGSIHEYAPGLAVVRVEGPTEINAKLCGTVSSVEIATGQPELRVVELRVVSLFPGHYRPLIEPGMALRLELRGYEYAYQHLVVESIGEEVVGPGEARRILGASIADAVPLDGPVVFVHARLPAKTFESRGRVYEYYDGMQGRAEVRVRSESILTTVFPGLKAVLSDAHG